MRIYFDTSALVKAFVHEPGSDEVKTFIAQTFPRNDVVFSTAVITKAEVGTALAAMRRNRELSAPKYQQAIDDPAIPQDPRQPSSFCHLPPAHRPI